MANFPGLQMTSAGRGLQAKAQTGVPLNFSRVAIGDGEKPADLDPLTGLVSEKKSLDLAGFELLGDGTSKLKVLLINEGLVEGFFIREIGVFAIDPDTSSEVLYSYANAEQYSDYLPAFGGETIVEMTFDLITVVGNATTVTATINDYLVHATKADVDELRPYVLPSGGLVGQQIRKASNVEGDYELYDPTEGVQFRINSVTEERTAVEGQTVFALTKTLTNGLAIYVNGLRIPNTKWSAIGGSNIQFDEPLFEGDKVQLVNNEEVGTVSLARVSLDGPDLIYVGTTNNYTITDYDSFSTYAVSSSVGTASISDNVITLIIPTEASTDDGLILTVERNDGSNSFQIALGAQVVAKPQVTSPQYMATDVAENPSISGSAFATYPSQADTHLNTDYQIASDVGFINVVWESLENSSGLVGVNVPKDYLQVSTVYYLRIRYRGDSLGESAWSDVVSFTTKGSFYYYPAGNYIQTYSLQKDNFDSFTFKNGSLFALDYGDGLFRYSGYTNLVASNEASNYRGLAHLNGNIYVAKWFQPYIDVYDSSLNYLYQISIPIDSQDGVRSLDFANNNLIALTINGHVFVMNGATSSLNHRFSVKSNIPYSAGIAFDGVNLIVSDSSRFIVFNGTSNSIKKIVPTGLSGITDISYDGQNLLALSSRNLYRFGEE